MAEHQISGIDLFRNDTWRGNRLGTQSPLLAKLLVNFKRRIFTSVQSRRSIEPLPRASPLIEKGQFAHQRCLQTEATFASIFDGSHPDSISRSTIRAMGCNWSCYGYFSPMIPIHPSLDSSSSI
ncbi:hypothetical protein THAOC_01496 [Thalassiosira oceanica]|uniref:Uncharacterized protein n=1 Tax=Thalassiosira oceanica TaxID=159749 RepID=K0TDI7_THAOC|nr:hypothetical protein THAOC_01496 [Thalassiosira oceanica]|eukprot:EJK76723.1 hypothetical protein THAOC_01496 [Thalassiosira oceanica]